MHSYITCTYRPPHTHTRAPNQHRGRTRCQLRCCRGLQPRLPRPLPGRVAAGLTKQPAVLCNAVWAVSLLLGADRCKDLIHQGVGKLFRVAADRQCWRAGHSTAGRQPQGSPQQPTANESGTIALKQHSPNGKCHTFRETEKHHSSYNTTKQVLHSTVDQHSPIRALYLAESRLPKP